MTEYKYRNNSVESYFYQFRQYLKNTFVFFEQRNMIAMRILFIQHVAFEHPGSILRWVRELNYSYSILHIYEAPELPAPDDFDMLIIMGGPMGVFEEDKYRWLKTEKEFISTAILAGKKVLGICLGCQLIASVLGASVYKHTQKEIGWWPVWKNSENKNHPIIKELPDVFTSFHWHGDTFDLPANALHLFSSEACNQQGFIYKSCVVGLQFHPEVEEKLFSELTENDKKELMAAKFVQSEEEMKQHFPLFINNQYFFIKKILGYLIDC